MAMVVFATMAMVVFAMLALVLCWFLCLPKHHVLASVVCVAAFVEQRYVAAFVLLSAPESEREDPQYEVHAEAAHVGMRQHTGMVLDHRTSGLPCYSW